MAAGSCREVKACRSSLLLLALLGLVALLAVGSGAATASTASPLGPLRIELMSDIQTDPAVAFLTTAWELEHATCATLLNYPDAPAPEGTRLRPEIAAAMPAISNNGRTYTFQIRNDYAFSPPATGVVTAQSMKYTFERTLAHDMASPAFPFFANIVGATEYNNGQAQHISGIVAAADTLTIDLIQPQGEFLTLLAMPFLCAVPTTLPPGELETGALPSAGPYYISGRTPGASIVLSRNPNYVGARPSRFDSIEYTIGRSEQEIFNRVVAGLSDYGFDVPAAERQVVVSQWGPDTPAAARGLQRYFVNPLNCVGYIPLNTERPLFADVNMRKAVNYAIDRTALVATAGPLAGSTTDQYLPPGSPGFSDIQLYPDHADLAVARQLAGWQEGDPPRPAVLYYRTSGSINPQQAQLLHQELLGIGIDATMVGFAGADIYNAIGTRGEPFDLAVSVGWCSDYFDPWPFLQTLDGTLIQAQNNNNWSYFNDPAVNDRLHAARALVGDPRYDAFEQIEHDLVRDAAPYAAWRTYNAGGFFAERIGCQLYQNAYQGFDFAGLCIRPAITVDDASATEPLSGTATATFTVRLSSEMEDPVTVDFATADGTAHAGADYVATSGTLTFEPNERSKTVNVTVNGDSVGEPTETFSLNLSNENSGTMVDGQGVGSIRQSDTAPPETTITSGPDGPTSDATPTFAFSSEAGASFECRIDGAGFSPCTSPLTTAPLADGAHSFAVRALDAYGNIDPSPAGRSFSVDTTPPETTITSGPTGTTTDKTPTFGFSSEVGARFECRLDLGAFAGCSSPHTTAALSVGDHTFEVRAIDGVGNSDATPASRAFAIQSLAGRTTVSLVSTSVAVTREAVAPIRLRCGAAPCHGTLTLTATTPRHPATIGTKLFSIPARHTAAVKVKLTPRGYKLLVQRKRLVAKLRITFKQPVGRSTVMRSITLRAPGRR